MTAAEAVLVGGPWDGHVEPLKLDAEGRPPALLPRHRHTMVFTEDTGYLPMSIPERPYRLRGPDPADGNRWIYEPADAGP
jgi:hypothetical protein